MCETPRPIHLSELIEQQGDKKTISLPLQFYFLPVELLSKQFTKLNNNNPYRIHYLGPRPHSTLSIHKKYAYSEKRPWQMGNELQGRNGVQRYRVDNRRIVESYFVQEKLRVNTFYKSTIFYRAFEGMNPTLNLDNEFVFNSIFESGNLDCVIKVEENEFDLFLRIDSNTKGHVQWFYFSVQNAKRKQKIKLNLCNLSKAKSLYQNGMQPYVFSKNQYKLTGRDWAQDGLNLGLTKKELRYDYLSDKLTKYAYYCLEFQYQFQHQNDEVFFAYCVPYTFSKLVHEIQLLPPKYTVSSVLGKSLSGIDIPILHITDFQANNDKKNILITGRMHPGESNSSHMLEGFIKFLNSSHKDACELRKRINFFIIPMVNPDGVIIGNTRTSTAGKDLNRQFLLANRDQHPQVSLIKDFGKRLHHRYGAFMYLDFHGHSRKKNTFFYGPAFGISEPNYYKCRILPKLIQKINSNFRFHSCSFTIDQQKKQTARAIMFEHLRINFTFTIQTSIGYYYDCQNLRTVQFNQQEWRKMGQSIAEGLSKFIIGFEDYEQLLKERRASRQKKRPPTTGSKGSIDFRLQAEEQISFFKRIQPLKIVYNDKSLFGEVIEQLKTTRPTNYIKEIDDDCESDSHDQNQQFQHSKMKEFNKLLTDVAQKTSSEQKSKEKEKDRKSPIKEVKSERDKNRSQTLNNLQNIEEELRFFEELQEISKPMTVHAHREKKKAEAPSIKLTTFAKRQTKKSLQFKKTQNYRTAVLTQNPATKKQLPQTANCNIQKKFSSQVELQRDRQPQKLSYFGEYHLYVDVNERRQDKIYQRNSLFRRQKSKKNRKGQMEQSRFMSQTFLERPSNKHVVEVASNLRIIPKISPPKSNNYQFKFDEIETAVIAKQKFKDYYRGKVNKSSRNSVIGPASFYGIRQNINLKLNNRKKFFSQQRNEGFNERESINIIKFT